MGTPLAPSAARTVQVRAQAAFMGGSAADLLVEFRATGRQAAFEEIVRRYAGMVFHTCRQVTRSTHDAEDATQAVFLTLAVHLKAGREIRALGPWLGQVAHRIALDLRKSRKRRHAREHRHGTMDASHRGNGDGSVHCDPLAGLDLDELKGVMGEALNQLPPKYRLPLILHYFGGLSREEIAGELALKPGTLGVRLHRAREMLGKILAGRNIVLPAAALAAGITYAVRSTVSDSLVASTCRAAAQLASGNGIEPGLLPVQVLTMTRSATRALALAKVKAVAVFTVLAGSAVAAGAEVVSRVRPIDFPLRVPLEVRDVLPENILPRWNSPLSEHSQGTDPPTPEAVAIDSKPAPSSPRVPSGAPVMLPSDHPFAFVEAPLFPPLELGPTFVARDRAPTGSTIFQPSLVFGGAAQFTPAPAFRPGYLNPTGVPARNGPLAASSNVIAGGSSPTRPDIEPPARPISPSPPVVQDHAPKSTAPSRPTQRTTPAVNPAGETEFAGPAPTTPATPQSTPLPDLFLNPTPTAVAAAASSASPVELEPSSGFATRGVNLLADAGASYRATIIADPSSLSGISSLTWLSADSQPVLSIVRSRFEWTPDGLHGGANIGGGQSFGVTRIPLTISQGQSLVLGPGLIRGYGTIQAARSYDHSGTLIADGGGQDRALELISVGEIRNGVDNPADGRNGWYAVNHGKLSLPWIAVRAGTGEYAWGESSADSEPDLVNAVRVTVKNAQSDGTLKMSLLAVDRTDLPGLPAEEANDIIGLWQFDAGDLGYDGLHLKIRYDDRSFRDPASEESDLGLWIYDGAWEQVEETTIDPENDLLSAETGRLSYFALVHSGMPAVYLSWNPTTSIALVPEPGAGAVLALAGALLLRRRRRDHAIP